MSAVILTMIIYFGGYSGAVTIVAEYSNLQNCQLAAEANREKLTSGKVILATCTRK